MIWDALLFTASAAVVVVAAVFLARATDQVGEASGLGRLWAGSVLLAAATSLPEAVAGVSAVRLGDVDLAAGDLFGAAMMNMLTLAIIDLMPPRQQVLRQATLDHALAATLAMSLVAIAALAIVTRSAVTVGWLSPFSILLAVVYVAGTRAVYRHAVREGGAPVAQGAPRPPLRGPLVRFGAATLVVLATAPLLAWSAGRLADASGLGNTFVGTLLVGFATALPELVACLTAVRMRAFDLAVGNLFGSNAFNMALFVVVDASQSGSVFAVLAPQHLVTALFAMLMMALGVAALVYRAQRRFAMLEPDSLLILIAYVIGIVVLHSQTAR